MAYIWQQKTRVAHVLLQPLLLLLQELHEMLMTTPKGPATAHLGWLHADALKGTAAENVQHGKKARHAGSRQQYQSQAVRRIVTRLL